MCQVEFAGKFGRDASSGAWEKVFMIRFPADRIYPWGKYASQYDTYNGNETGERSDEFVESCSHHSSGTLLEIAKTNAGLRQHVGGNDAAGSDRWRGVLLLAS